MSRFEPSLRWVILAASVLAGGRLGLGCVSDDFVDGQFLCNPSVPDDSCPPGLRCAADGRCRRGGGAGGSNGGHGGSGGEGGLGGCTPTSCEQLLPSCQASVPDGCGHELDCTTACPSPSTCEGGDVPERCGCPALLSLPPLPPGHVTNHDYGQLVDVWTDLEGAKIAGDGVRAHTQDPLPVTHETDYLDLDQFGFAVPADATILGIELRVTRSKTGGGSIRDYRIELLRDVNVPSFSNLADSVHHWPTSDATATYGNPTERWGETWSPADVNAATFGARVQGTSDGATGTSATPQVDYVELEVFYQPACPIPR